MSRKYETLLKFTHGSKCEENVAFTSIAMKANVRQIQSSLLGKYEQI